MVVNKEGDLEVHLVHDSPKQASWSARGSLVIGSGADLKVVEGYKDEALEDDFDLEAVKQSSYKHSAPSEKDRSHSRSGLARDESLRRGRAGKSGHIIAPLPVVPSPPPPFGRGDDGGFPALGSVVTPTGLSATRPGKPRTYSPASMRKFGNIERDDFGSRRGSLSPGPPPTVESRSRGRDTSPSAARRKHKGRREGKTKGIDHIVEQDISMIMRRRVLRGYGLSKVCPGPRPMLCLSLQHFSHKTTYTFLKTTMSHQMDQLNRFRSCGLGYSVRFWYFFLSSIS